MSLDIDNDALSVAQEAQRKIEDSLDKGHSFRLEAGAGAGKTYSLVSALKRIILDKGEDYIKTGQKVACITYTEVARNEIAQDIEEHPAILVNTIHGFCWGFLRQFQKPLRELINTMEDKQSQIQEGGGIDLQSVDYSFGYFKVDETQVSLSHEDIPRIMAELMENEKFRDLLLCQYPIIFVDEYQDTDQKFMTAITEHFLKPKIGPLIGLFGDHWQTIYRSDYELANYPIEEIAKGSNFRSAPAVVDVLNRLRPGLAQISYDPELCGEARLFHTNEYLGERTNSRHSKNDLLPDKAKNVRERLVGRLTSEGWDMKKTKILMLTHNVLAAEQGYPEIAEIFKKRNDQFVRKEDPVIKFCADVVEPINLAFQESRYGDMFKILGNYVPAISTHQDKVSWRNDMKILQELRVNGTVGEVMDHLISTGRPMPTARIVEYTKEIKLSKEDVDKPSLERYIKLRAVPYREIINLIKFLDKQTSFATQHSVKGAEFENVLVILGGGWNHYNWPVFFEVIGTGVIDEKNKKAHYRTRNLFYVSISRPMKRLAVLTTQTLSEDALVGAHKLFGAHNIKSINF